MDFVSGLKSSFELVLKFVKTREFWTYFALGFAIIFATGLFSYALTTLGGAALQSDSGASFEKTWGEFTRQLPFIASNVLLSLIFLIFALNFFVILPFYLKVLASKKFNTKKLTIENFFGYIWVNVKVLFLSIFMVPNKIVGFTYLGLGGLALGFFALSFGFSGFLKSAAQIASLGALVLTLMVWLFVMLYNGVRLSFSSPNFWINSKSDAIKSSLLQTRGKVLTIFFQVLIPSLLINLALGIVFGVPLFGVTALVDLNVVNISDAVLEIVTTFFDSIVNSLTALISIIISLNVFSIYSKKNEKD